MCPIEKERGHSLQGGPAAHRTLFQYEGNITQVKGGYLTKRTAVEGKILEMKHYGICAKLNSKPTYLSHSF